MMNILNKLFRKDSYIYTFLIIGIFIASLNYLTSNFLFNFFTISISLSISYWFGTFCHYHLHFYFRKHLHKSNHVKSSLKYLIFLLLQYIILLFGGYFLDSISMQPSLVFFIQPVIMMVINYLLLTKFVYKNIS